MQAAVLLQGPDQPARGWQIIHDPDLRPEDAQRQRMGHMCGPVFIRPDPGQAGLDLSNGQVRYFFCGLILILGAWLALNLRATPGPSILRKIRGRGE